MKFLKYSKATVSIGGAILVTLVSSCGDTPPAPPQESQKAGNVSDVPSAGEPQKPAPRTVFGNETLTGNAWKALGKNDHSGAIAAAEQCIKDFEPRALQIQERLAKEKVILPIGGAGPVGTKAIHANGILNDVAVCYFIKGVASATINRRDEALAAFESAAKFTYARAWDSKTSRFWSVADAVRGEIAKLKKF